LFTFDYELFLGADSGNVNECLLRPTDLVMNILERHGFKGIFFVDTLYLLRLKEIAATHEKANADLRAVEAQLVQLLERGHFIYPHIHPHWEQAGYDAQKNTWQLTDLSNYCFHSISETLRDRHFNQSLQLIREWQQRADVNYAIDAYRAGGWSIQPFSDFAPYFFKYNIVYDFSVIPQSQMKSDVVSYDFTNISSDAVYRFSSDVNQPQSSGNFIEVPISSIDRSGFAFYKELQDKWLWRTEGGRSMGKGRSIAINVTSVHSAGEMTSIELLTGAKVNAYLHYVRNNEYMQFISHPKMLSRHNLKSLEKFLAAISTEFTFVHDWKKSVDELLTATAR
jgi:hypothetical protein